MVLLLLKILIWVFWSTVHRLNYLQAKMKLVCFWKLYFSYYFVEVYLSFFVNTFDYDGKRVLNPIYGDTVQSSIIFTIDDKTIIPINYNIQPLNAIVQANYSKGKAKLIS